MKRPSLLNTSIMTIVFISLVPMMGVTSAQAPMLSMERKTDRPGLDYRSFDLSEARPELCGAACADDPNCKAYTYVNPGVQGQKARCHLKSGIPNSTPSQCCVSGIKYQVIIKEIPSFQISAEDPILKVRPPGLLAIPKVEPGFEHEGSYSLAEKTHWLPIAQIDLKPGQSHEINVTFSEPTLVLARATWLGSSVPVKLLVSKDKEELAKGKVHAVPPDRGTATARAEIKTPGNATVSVINGGSAAVKIEVVVGALALSLRR